MQRTRSNQLIRRSRAIAIGLGATLAAGLLATSGCSSSGRHHGPPQAEGYATSLWHGTPPALQSRRVAGER